MNRFIGVGLDTVHGLVNHARQVVSTLRAQKRLWIPGAIAVALSVLVTGAGWYWSATRASTAQGALSAEEDWRYLVVCNDCGYRTQCVEHPTRKMIQQEGLLKCPQCGRFQAAWYRRGSQAVPPGGW